MTELKIPQGYVLIKSSGSAGLKIADPAADAESQATSVESKTKPVQNLRTVLPRTLAAKMARGGAGTIFRTKLGSNSTVTINSSTGKYLQFMYGTTYTTNASLFGVFGEFASLSTIFDEVFLHNVVWRFEPVNMMSNNSTSSATAAGQPGFLNTCGAVIYGHQHDEPAFTDSNTTVQNMMCGGAHKVVNLAKTWTYKWTNIERYDKKGAATKDTAVTQTWCNVLTAPTVYGGAMSVATPFPSGTTATIAALLCNGIPGNLFLQADMSFRVRF